MINKKLAFMAIPVIAAIMIGTGASTQLAIADPDGSNPQSAFILKDFGCGVFDGDGNVIPTSEGTISVVTNGPTTILKCQASGIPNTTGSAQTFKGFLCNTFLGATTDTSGVTSKGGEATIICRINSAAQNP